MNVVHSIFDRSTGLFIGQVLNVPLEALAVNVPFGYDSMEGIHDPLSRRVDLSTMQIVDYQPPQPSVDHVWNETAKRWQLSPAAAARIADREAALQQIASLEASQPRAVRELLLGRQGASVRLAEIDERIVELRKLL